MFPLSLFRSNSIRRRHSFLLSLLIWLSFTHPHVSPPSWFCTSLPLYIHPFIYIYSAPLLELLWLIWGPMCFAPQGNGTHCFSLSTLGQATPSSSTFPTLFLFLFFTHVFLFHDLINKTKPPVFKKYSTTFRHAEVYLHESTAHGTSSVNVFERHMAQL